jgi:hypothetical protein
MQGLGRRAGRCMVCGKKCDWPAPCCAAASRKPAMAGRLGSSVQRAHEGVLMGHGGTGREARRIACGTGAMEAVDVR